ncbi:GntR family transcriptional regulator [Paracidovorax citrulli]
MSEAVVPLYHQIYVVLRQQIVEGRFGQGPLPGEIDLAKQFQASRVTMRRVFDRLVQEGLVRRHRGLGTFVNPHPIKPAATAAERPASLLDNLIDMGEKTSVKVLSIDEVQAPPDVAGSLGLDPGAPVTKVVRLRHYKGAPLSHITVYLPAELGRHLTWEALEHSPMLRLLESRGGLKLGRATQVLSARLADVVVAPLLDVPVGAALLATRRVVHDKAGRPIQLLLGQYRPDRYEYRMELSPAGGDSANVWVENGGQAGLRE